MCLCDNLCIRVECVLTTPVSMEFCMLVMRCMLRIYIYTHTYIHMCVCPYVFHFIYLKLKNDRGYNKRTIGVDEDMKHALLLNASGKSKRNVF